LSLVILRLLVKHIICLLLFVSLSLCVFSQRYQFELFGVEDGLAQSQVFCIKQDSRGNIWFGTFGGGITRYNGSEFLTLTSKEGLSSNTVYDILEDSNGNLWFLTNDGLCRYIPPAILSSGENLNNSLDGSNHFTTFKIENGLLDNTGYFLFQDTKQNIWVGSRKGITVLPKNNRLKNTGDLFSSFTVKDGLTDSIVMCIAEDQNDIIALGTYGGVTMVRFNIENVKNSPFELVDTITDNNGLIENHIRDIVKDKEGNLLLLSKKGISKFSFNESSNSEPYILKHYEGLDLFQEDRYLRLLLDSKDNLWLSTMGGGVNNLILNDETNKVDISYRFYTKTGLPNDDVWYMTEDFEGNLWISVNGAGVAQYRGGRFQSISMADGLGNNTVFTIFEDDKGRYWFGTYGGGISIYDPTKEIDDRLTTINTKNGLPEDYIYHIHVDSEGNYWISTRGTGVSIYNGSTFKTFGTNEGLSSNFILGIEEDSHGNIWVGTQRGLSKFVKEGNRYKVYNYDKKNGLCANVVYALLLDSKDNLWVGTTEGVNVISSDQLEDHETDFAAKHFHIDNGLINNEILSLYEDSKENIWIGTQGGVSLYNPDKYETGFQSFSSEYGLSSDLIYLIIGDNDGNIWFGTNKGIDKFEFDKRGNIVVTNYGKLEGFTGIETNHNAVYKDRNGALWFGTIEGVVKYNPEEDIKNTKEPLTHITDLRISFKKKELPSNKEFSYYENHMTFDFISMSLTIPEKVKYQWKLEGFDDTWSPVTDQTSATYSNVSPGKYTFNVIACNNDGVWNTKPITYSFKVLPPFWQTWWFYTISISTVIIGIYLFIRIRLKNLERAKILLEQKVEERTRELSQANEEIQNQKEIVDQKNKDITASINYAQRIQDAILPKPQHIESFFPESFIYYKVKDVVSGDFPWLMKKGDDLFISVIDCTGHGVPGAMLSMIGHFLLKEIVYSRGISDPGEILMNLHDGVNDTLRQDENLESRDGMDAAFCRINYKKGELDYAGAHRALYYIKNGGMEKFEGNKFPIGGTQYSSRRKINFKTHKIKFDKSDSIYFFSDGLPDQIGGPKNKKFLSSRVQDFILENSKLSMKDFNKKIDNEFTQWQGKNKQIDDVLMIGIKL